MKLLATCEISSSDMGEWLEENYTVPGYEVSRAKIEEDHHSQMTEGTPLAPRLTVEMTELARKTLQLFDIFKCSANLQFNI